jgi:hypothetical protein
MLGSAAVPSAYVRKFELLGFPEHFRTGDFSRFRTLSCVMSITLCLLRRP